MLANAKRLHVSLGFLLLAVALLSFADLGISTLHPFLETKRFFLGITNLYTQEFNTYFKALLDTVSIAIVAIVFSSFFGFLLSIFFRFTLLRVILAFLRSIHELFWALIFLQIFGLSTLTGLLAIIIPYSAILAKVYAEILEEHDTFPKELRSRKASAFVVYMYTKLPDALPHILSYTLYRFECALKSTAILGFIGLPTLGYYLESAFMEGHYGDVWVLLLLFYLLIASIRLWVRPKIVPFLFLLSFYFMESSPAIHMKNLWRFFSQDIIPSPLKKGEDLHSLYVWFENIFVFELIPGAINTIIVTQIALVLTAFIALISFPLISRVLTKNLGKYGGGLILVVLRSTPEYILAYLFLQLFGPSMLPAILALALHNGAIIGFIMGKQSSKLKLRLDTTKRSFERYSYEVVPRIYSSFLAFLFYRWEVIMRESAILGILGVQTLGFFVDSAIADFRLDKMAILLFFTALLNIAIDMISRKVRHYLHVKEQESTCKA